MDSAVTAAFSRRELIRVPGISGASVSRRGPRSLNADAAASWTDQDTGHLAFVVADGVGDHLPAARAARLVAATAAQAGARAGAKAGILAAQGELLRQLPEQEADSVLVVAVRSVLGGPWDIAWVGDCRAYRWNGRVLHQITNDHTVAEYFRALGRPAPPRTSHLVTTSARTAAAADIGQAETGVSDGRLLLSTDGVHKRLDMPAIKDILARPATPGVAADALVEGARAAGSTDNATALVVDCF
ncbi:PP2C family protein-serine/threonine phosphatase [Nocardia albiluteola]|uniref:PP2C family protein-serine/threonine phosphatase n=1 Tax=Nocardia albiluteola TaxID=2842303 RepID=UPI0027DEDC70|nr:protein phosphatase 2C domain-containing protein [Nocardia albiluteola]